MNLPKPNRINAEKYVAGLSLFNKKTAKIKLSANESALGPSPKAVTHQTSLFVTGLVPVTNWSPVKAWKTKIA